MYASSTREFKKATGLFLDTVSTFTCNEIMSYKRFVELTVLMSMYSLSRVDLKKKVVLGPEIQEILHQSPVVKNFLEALVECNYAAFYKSLGEHAFAYPFTARPSPIHTRARAQCSPLRLLHVLRVPPFHPLPPRPLPTQAHSGIPALHLRRRLLPAQWASMS